MAMKKFGPDKKKGMKADAARKTSQAQSMAMDKVKAKKSAMADTKRKAAEAKTYPPAKKAPSSAALGLTKKKTASAVTKKEETLKKKKGML